MYELLKNAVWGKGLKESENLTLFFRLKFNQQKSEKINLTLSAKQLYKVIFNGEFVHYGPERCAHGYSKVDSFLLSAKEGENVIVVEVYNAGVYNYYLPLESPYFCACVETTENTYFTDDFICYHANDRVEKSQRYCGQRTFVEDYVQDDCRSLFYMGKDKYPAIKTESAKKDVLIQKDCEYPLLKNFNDEKLIESGWFKIIDAKKKYKLPILNRIRKNGEKIDYEVLTDIVNSFVYYAGKPRKDYGVYYLYEFEREISGFINLELDVLKDAEIFVIFDELLQKQKSQKGAKQLNFARISCANVVRWKLKKGKYNLSTFEAYSFKFVKIIVKSGKIDNYKLSAVRYENGSKEIFSCKIEDKELENIVSAAYNTYRQNAVDMLFDCPSRERAGWINDAWFSRECPEIFSGNDKPFLSLLRAYALAPDLGLPKGMIPMCYPSDFRTGLFMVACAMWYVCCLNEYSKTHGKDDIVIKGKEKVKDFLEYLKPFENEYGLLENLKGKIFVEWSRANTKLYVKGVNFPSNMLYYKTLVCASELLEDSKLSEKAKALKEKIIKLSFNGEFFEDNVVRKKGILTRVNHVTEVCQYYAFECGVADKETFKTLYKTLVNNFVPRKLAPEKYSYITRSNIIIGLCIRIKQALINGEYDRLLSEIKSIYSVMAEKTNTLWEHDRPKASCNHGIAAFAGVCVIKAITGYQGVKNGVAIFKKVEYKTNCDVTIPCKKDKIRVVVKEGKVDIYTNIKYKIV